MIREVRRMFVNKKNHMSSPEQIRILVTGATGNIGSALCAELASQGKPFTAMVRSADAVPKLNLPDNATYVLGDFNDPESIKNALQGINAAFLVTNSSEDAERLQTSFVEVAKEVGLQHIVKLSQWAADLLSPVRFLRYHAAVEEKIKASGITYTFLRPNLFMQGLLGFKDFIAKQGQFFASVGDARISAVDVRDIAAVAAAALTGGALHYNQTYNLTGPEALTHSEMAKALEEALKTPVRFVDVSPADLRQALLQVGFPDWQAEGLIEDYAHYSRSEASEISRDIERVTGKNPIDFRTFARDYATYFLQPA